MKLQSYNNKNREALIKQGAIWLSLLAMLIFCFVLLFDDFEMPQKTISINIDVKDKITSTKEQDAD
ncbi:MAG: hypothetical protein FJ368_02315 [Pelagibacterales bacterium]|nr:hypothetical protein [Pelagibacterales bacterium]